MFLIKNQHTWPFASLLLGLIMLTTGYFSFYAATQAERILSQQALDSGLFELEKPYYLSFYARNARLDIEQSETHLAQLKGLSQLSNAQQAWAILQDRAFFHYMTHEAPKFIPDHDYAFWIFEREEIEAQLHSLHPRFHFGLTPESPSVSQLFSKVFVNTNSLFYTAGSILLLILLMLNERFLRRIDWAFWAFTCVGLSSLLELLVSNTASAPLTGPAAWLSAQLFLCALLLNEALGKARFRKHTLVWGITLLLWGLLAIFQYYILQKSLVFLATQLAIIPCLILILRCRTYLFGDHFARDGARFDSPEDSDSYQYRHELAKAFKTLEDFDFETARDQFEQLSEHYPNDLKINRQFFQLCDLAYSPSMYTVACNRFALALSAQLNRPDAMRLLRSLEHHPKDENLTPSYTILVRLFLNVGELQPAEKCFTLMRLARSPSDLLSEAAHLIQSELRRRGELHKVPHYDQFKAA